MRKKIAITGATGFLGKYLVTDLLKDENIDLFLFSTSLEKLKQTFCDKTNLQFIETDYSYNSLKENFADFDTVIHLAAKRLVSNQNALTDYHCNISSTENLMKVCDDNNVDAFIFASSIGVYDSLKNRIPFAETEPPSPMNAYGISKLSCEKLQERYKTKVINLRLGQLIGWGEREEYMFTQSLNKIIQNETITLWGEGGGGRDYIYTKDVVRIIKTGVEKKIAGTFNVGSGRHASFKELVETIAEVFGNNTSTIRYDETKIENREIRYMCIEKVKKEYNWTPKYSLKEALSDMLSDSKNGVQ